MPMYRVKADRTRTALVLGSLGAVRVFTDQDDIWTMTEHAAAELAARGVPTEVVQVVFEEAE